MRSMLYERQAEQFWVFELHFDDIDEEGRPHLERTLSQLPMLKTPSRSDAKLFAQQQAVLLNRPLVVTNAAGELQSIEDEPEHGHNGYCIWRPLVDVADPQPTCVDLSVTQSLPTNLDMVDAAYTLKRYTVAAAKYYLQHANETAADLLFVGGHDSREIFWRARR